MIIGVTEKDERIVETFELLAPSGVAISAITYMEVFQGIVRKHVNDRLVMLGFIDGLPLIPVNRAVAMRCALIRADLVGQQKRIRSRALDLLIAATAVEFGLVLVTRNIDDYKDITGLELYR
jgi:predicted nucleic acid-binding protein